MALSKMVPTKWKKPPVKSVCHSDNLDQPFSWKIKVFLKNKPLILHLFKNDTLSVVHKKYNNISNKNYDEFKFKCPAEKNYSYESHQDKTSSIRLLLLFNYGTNKWKLLPHTYSLMQNFQFTDLQLLTNHWPLITDQSLTLNYWPITDL